MHLVPPTGFPVLSQYLGAVTGRSVSLLPLNAFREAAGLIAGACASASLTGLAQELRSENPHHCAEALQTIGSSEDIQRRIASRFSDAEETALQTQTRRIEDMAAGRDRRGLKLLFLGDIHDVWGPVKKIIKHECSDANAIVLGVGDLETYKTLPSRTPFLFSHGNHEDPAEMTKIRARPEPVWGEPYPLLPGEFMILQGGLAVGAFSGIYEPGYFESGASDQFPYFSQSDVSKAFGIPLSLDIFLSHEAPAGIGFLKDGRDLGARAVTDVLEKLQPKVALFGHHHWSFDGHLGKTQVIGLDYPKRSYVTATVDEEGGFEFVRHESKLMVENGGQKVYRYDWERGETRDDREDKDDEGRRRLFSIALPSLMSREEEIDRMLDQQYRSKLKVRLVPTFLARVGKKDDTERTRQLLAEGLINGIFNTILPYFARYYTSLKATLSEKERERLRQNALQQMLKDQARIAFAHNDLILVFDELRKLVDEG